MGHRVPFFPPLPTSIANGAPLQCSLVSRRPCFERSLGPCVCGHPPCTAASRSHNGLPACLSRVWLGAFDLAFGHAHARGIDRDGSVLVGAVAAAVAFWTMALSVDTIKTMQQASSSAHSSARLLARDVWRRHGLGGFYGGVVPVFTRGLLLDIIQFSAADQVRRRLPSPSSPLARANRQ